MLRPGMVRALLAAAILAPSLAAAETSVEAFYEDRQCRIVIPFQPGGSYDLLARLLIEHIGKHIPGNPSFVAINMPGSGGIRAANHVALTAPQDGSVLTIVSQGVVLHQVRSNEALKADMSKMNWLGNMSYSNQVLAVWHTSPVKTLADAMKHEVVVGATGRGSISVQLPAAYNYLLGTKVRIIWGYKGSSGINLAIERGEVEGRASNTWAGYRSERPGWIRENKLNYIVQTGLVKEPGLPDVPLLIDAVKGDPEKEAVARTLSRAVQVGRPIAVAPDVPAERVAALRKAFNATVVDPEFLKDAARANIEIRTMTGQEMTKLVKELIATPKSVVEKVNYAIDPPDDMISRAKEEKQ